MIEHIKTIELLGKPLFTLVSIKAPIKVITQMPSDEACFAYILEGGVHEFSESEELIAQQQEAILSKCGNYVVEMLGSKTSGNYRSLTIHFHNKVMLDIYKDSLPSFLKTKELHRHPKMAKIESSKLLDHYINGILHYFESEFLVTEDILILKLKEIILLLFQTESSDQIIDLMNNLFAPKTYNFRQIIEAHTYSTISISELASLVPMSISSFKREFQKQFNTSPSNYFIQKKTERVANLLRLTDKSISELAYECGFKNVSHLSKVFKLKYGLPPSQYRLNF